MSIFTKCRDVAECIAIRHHWGQELSKILRKKRAFTWIMKIYSFSVSLIIYIFVYISSCFTALANYWEWEETSPMAKLFFNYPLWDFPHFSLRHLLPASPTASATKTALFKKMAAFRGRFSEWMQIRITLVSGALFIQTGLDSAVFITAKPPTFKFRMSKTFLSM